MIALNTQNLSSQASNFASARMRLKDILINNVSLYDPLRENAVA